MPFVVIEFVWIQTVDSTLAHRCPGFDDDAWRVRNHPDPLLLVATQARPDSPRHATTLDHAAMVGE